MLSLFYLPIVLYDIIRAYVLPPNDAGNEKTRHRIHSKYSSDQKEQIKNETKNIDPLDSQDHDNITDDTSKDDSKSGTTEESTSVPVLSEEMRDMSYDKSLSIAIPYTIPTEVSQTSLSAFQFTNDTDNDNIVAKVANVSSVTSAIPPSSSFPTDKPDKYVTLEDSDDSDYESYLNDIVSVQPSSRTSSLNDVVSVTPSSRTSSLNDVVSVTPSSRTSSINDVVSVTPSSRTPTNNTSFSSDKPDWNYISQLHNVLENEHITILDDPLDTRAALLSEASEYIPSNSFLAQSSTSPDLAYLDPPLNSISTHSDLPCSSKEDGYESNNHAMVDSCASSLMPCDQVFQETSDLVSRGTNHLIGNPKSASEEKGCCAGVSDDPVQTTYLTSQKNAPITKYVSKERQKRRRSDLEWNQYMEKCMLAGARGKIMNSFRECFKEAFDSYRLCCELLVTFGITHASGKSALQKAAVEEIKRWKGDNVAPRASISNQLKALDVSYLCNATLFSGISEVYELDTVPAQEVVLFINEKLDHKKTKYLKHMAHIICQLNLQDHFDTPEILLPLLGMDKLMIIEAYLSKKEIAAAFVRSVDNLLEPTGESLTSLLNQLSSNFDYSPDTANFKFTPDQITTLIKRMLKVHHLDASDAPNLSLTKTVSNLKSLLYCKYKKGYNEDWTSTLVSTVQSNDMLVKVLFKELASYEDLEYAAVLYQKLNRPHVNLLPVRLQKYIASTTFPVEISSCSVCDVSSEAAGSSSTDTVVMATPPCPVTMTSPPVAMPTPHPVTMTSASLNQVLPKDPGLDNGFVCLPSGVSIFEVASVSSLLVCQDVLSSAGVIGFDSEWRALLDPTKPCPVALIQLATHSSCFLLDVSRILQCCSDAVLVDFVDAVFGDSVTVVGYSLGQDIIKLKETSHILGNKLGSHNGVVDLSVAHKHLTRVERLQRSHLIRELVSEGKPLPDSDNVSKETGLARLCQMIFTCPLDKTYQVSDWSRRPLLPEQRSYAALDAYILLPLFYKLQDKFHPVPLKELTVTVEQVPREFQNSSYIPAYSQPTAVHLLRVVVDTPCQGLGKKLRHLGIDCVILEDTQTVDDAAKISLSQGRIILSRDGNCEKLRKLTDPGRVYKVLGKSATDQLAEIRQHFNLVVTEGDLFSRCAICNCSFFVKIKPEQASTLKSAQEVCNSSTVEEQYEVFDRRMSCVETISVTTDGKTQYGVRLQLDKVNINKFSETKTFWGCYDCGKMYWDGCHIKNFKEKHNL